MIEENKLGGIKRFFAFYNKNEFEKVLRDSRFKVLESYRSTADDGEIWLHYFVEKP